MGRWPCFYILPYTTAVQELLIKNYHFTCCFKTNPVDTTQIETASALVVYKKPCEATEFLGWKEAIWNSWMVAFLGGFRCRFLDSSKNFALRETNKMWSWCHQLSQGFSKDSMASVYAFCFLTCPVPIFLTVTTQANMVQWLKCCFETGQGPGSKSGSNPCSLLGWLLSCQPNLSHKVVIRMIKCRKSEFWAP